MASKLKEDTSCNDRQAWLTTLYKNAFPLVAKHISRMGGSLDEAQDIFQDALIIYYEKKVRSELSLEYSDKAYLFGIARHFGVNDTKKVESWSLLMNSILILMNRWACSILMTRRSLRPDCSSSYKAQVRNVCSCSAHFIMRN